MDQCYDAGILELKPHGCLSHRVGGLTLFSCLLSQIYSVVECSGSPVAAEIHFLDGQGFSLFYALFSAYVV